MSCKVGNKNHKARCERYKQSGRRIINKQKKAERHKKRMEKFAKRREEGKTYQYTPIPYKEGTKEYIEEKRNRASKNVSHSTPTSIYDSVMRKLDNRLAKEREALKVEEIKKNKKKTENNIEQ